MIMIIQKNSFKKYINNRIKILEEKSPHTHVDIRNNNDLNEVRNYIIVLPYIKGM